MTGQPLNLVVGGGSSHRSTRSIFFWQLCTWVARWRSICKVGSSRPTCTKVQLVGASPGVLAALQDLLQAPDTAAPPTPVPLVAGGLENQQGASHSHQLSAPFTPTAGENDSQSLGFFTRQTGVPAETLRYCGEYLLPFFFFFWSSLICSRSWFDIFKFVIFKRAIRWTRGNNQPFQPSPLLGRSPIVPAEMGFECLSRLKWHLGESAGICLCTNADLMHHV